MPNSIFITPGLGSSSGGAFTPSGPVLFQSGVVGAPGAAFASEPTTGWYLAAPGDVRLSELGVDVATFKGNGSTNLTIPGTFSASDIGIQPTRFFYWTGRVELTSPADAQFNINNWALTSGIGLDVATDGTLKIRTRAQNADGSLSAGNGAFSGSVIAGESIYAGGAKWVGFNLRSLMSSPVDKMISFTDWTALLPSGISLGNPASAGAATKIVKTVTAIPNATLTTILNATIPNAAHSANILVTVVGSLGAGGAIGANEASASNSYLITLTRTAGVATVAAISAAFGAAASAVAGAATVTAVVTLAAVTGAVSVTQTLPIQITITRSTGASANHTCQVIAEVLNANATGVTIA